MSRAGLARHAARRDPGEDDIVRALEARGLIVRRLSTKGMPDLLVMVPGNAEREGRVCLVEVKSPPGPRGGTSAKGRRLSDEQQRFYELVRGKRLPVYIATTPEQAILAVLP